MRVRGRSSVPGQSIRGLRALICEPQNQEPVRIAYHTLACIYAHYHTALSNCLANLNSQIPATTTEIVYLLSGFRIEQGENRASKSVRVDEGGNRIVGLCRPSIFGRRLRHLELELKATVTTGIYRILDVLEQDK